MTRTVYDILLDERPHEVSCDGTDTSDVLLHDSPDLVDRWDEETGNEVYPLEFTTTGVEVAGDTATAIGHTALIDVPHTLFLTETHVRMEQTLPKLAAACFEKLKLHAVPQDQDLHALITWAPANTKEDRPEEIVVNLGEDVRVILYNDDFEYTASIYRPFSTDTPAPATLHIERLADHPKIHMHVTTKDCGIVPYDDSDTKEHIPEILETLQVLNFFADSLGEPLAK